MVSGIPVAALRPEQRPAGVHQRAGPAALVRRLRSVRRGHQPGYQQHADAEKSIQDVSSVVRDVMRQNRGVLVGKGTVGKYQISSTSGGVEYVVGINSGRVGQLYPK
jgi:hypothetical protein